MKRRDLLKTAPAAAAAAFAAPVALAAMGEGKTEGTPLQFAPKTPPDAEPLKDELAKYPRCPYCGMDRRQLHFSRHLVHYSDDLADGTCSMHCLALSLALNIDRMPKAIYAADNAAAEEPRPLVKVEQATYVLGGEFRAVMSKKAKTAFGTKEAAQAAQAKSGGELAGFDQALTESYLAMAEDTMMIRRKRDEMRRRRAEQKSG